MSQRQKQAKKENKEKDDDESADDGKRRSYLELGRRPEMTWHRNEQIERDDEQTANLKARRTEAQVRADLAVNANLKRKKRE